MNIVDAYECMSNEQLLTSLSKSTMLKEKCSFSDLFPLIVLPSRR